MSASDSPWTPEERAALEEVQAAMRSFSDAIRAYAFGLLTPPEPPPRKHWWQRRSVES